MVAVTTSSAVVRPDSTLRTSIFAQRAHAELAGALAKLQRGGTLVDHVRRRHRSGRSRKSRMRPLETEVRRQSSQPEPSMMCASKSGQVEVERPDLRLLQLGRVFAVVAKSCERDAGP